MAGKTIYCAFCGKEWNNVHPRRKFCNNKCRHKAYRDCPRETRCNQCDREIDWTKKRSDAEQCGRKSCWKQYLADRHRVANYFERKNRPNRQCELPECLGVVSGSSRPNQKFCSTKCKRRSANRRFRSKQREPVLEDCRE